jgi:hypothetical protein
MNNMYLMNAAGFLFSHGMWLFVAAIISMLIDVDYEWHGVRVVCSVCVVCIVVCV